jgi:4-diphosphocytidyl-2-C-methyl-D-erythritol kinase
LSAVTIDEFAAAKVNLYLQVTGRRPDGYHVLDSLVVFVDIGDRVSVSAADRLSLEVTGPFNSDLGLDKENNLVLRAARALAAEVGIEAGATVDLVKNLPVAAGIGGGSADAAATLRALLRLWPVSLDRERLFALALNLGADVPVCLDSATMVMSGIGGQLEPAPPNWPTLHLVLVTPGCALSTAAVFAAREGEFTPAVPLDLASPSIGDVVAALGARRNDLEPIARRLEPAIDATLASLTGQPDCLIARMSGSGATCFGLFASTVAASRAAANLSAAHSSWWVVAGSTL